ncbi:hypothetical protein ROSMUCSMR3_03338 [Roseovarius mucosus]|uniref:GIY-YIG catalytic domain protein n=1 Tax=Roseovarius mucosus TaxID=215743 RepID=A0A1V0RSP1_9RHOB|nr:hypothetical protein [Roseovarius mucosus]ARE84800.1 hypothetical protein ROSMUCSMR3_03338 [Roseovarius mucosus]
MALRDDILALIKDQPGITDAEIKRRIPGTGLRHQQVNARCRLLAEEGLIRRIKPSRGAIGNYPEASLEKPEGSPRPRVGEKPPPGGAVGGCPAEPPGATIQAVAPTCINIEFFWQSVGEIQFLDESLHFPHLPARAGLYRIRLPVSRSVYVGETVNLRRRMQNYRRPGATQTTSVWVNDHLRNRLRDGELVLLETCTDAMTTTGTIRQGADLKSKIVRVMIEHAAILYEKQANWVPLNKAN